MFGSTNHLVGLSKKIAAPAAIAGAFFLGAAMYSGHGNVHAAAAAYGAPLSDNSVSALIDLDHAMEAVAARVTPAVVNVAVTAKETNDNGDSSGQMQLPPGWRQFFGPMFNQPQQPQYDHGIGSGMIISPDGYILTNDHVVNGATQIKVTLHDRRVLNAKVVGVDKLTDLAVIKVNATDLPTIAWGDSTKLEPGQTVLAFGSPFGYFQFSVTRGIVSAVNRPNPYSDNPRKPGGYIQTDAAINPGNSGGPLVNARGEVIGVNTFIITNSGSFAGAGFAIPSQMAETIANEIIAHGKVEHGYLGIAMNDVTPDNAHFFKLKTAEGAIVAEVTPDSPASNGGLKQGDVITQLNGNEIVNGSALQVAVSEMRPGTAITLGVMRDGNPLTLHLTVGQYHGANNQQASNNGGPQSGMLGLGVSDLTPDARQQNNIPDSVHGVIVQNVRPGSPAEDAGIQPGDVIVQVNRMPVTSASQFADAVHQNGGGQNVLLLVWSKGEVSYITLSANTGVQNN
jgi:serine protease Do